MDDTTPVQANPGYAADRLARELATAATHGDPAVRQAAERRAASWRRVLDGMARGLLSIGSRTPVRGMPAWVTPVVSHGGFATGEAAAGGPLRPQERALIDRHGLKADRAALYAHHLTEAGLAHLSSLLDSGAYEIDEPEQAALLTVTWLLRAGDAAGALRVLGELDPFAAALCLTPRPAPARNLPEGSVFRWSVEDVRHSLADVTAKGAHRVKVQGEALAVWNPFADRLLTHWLETTADTGGPGAEDAGAIEVDARRPDGWTERGAALLDEYERLAAEHTLCTKHRRPKENLAILLAALREALTEGGLGARRRGLLRHAVISMTAKRGVPGSPGHTALRAGQAAQAARPAHDVLAALLGERLAPLPGNSGVPDTEAVLVPTSPEEARSFTVPEGAAIPGPLRARVERAVIAPLDALVERGVVPSAEVLASLVPALAAEAEASAIGDPTLSRLVAAHHRAFATRRSLLLLNLESQVRRNELPWVRESTPHHDSADTRRTAARTLITRLGDTVLTRFPGTITPNPLVSELNGLARTAGLELGFVEELASDIFMGTFSPKFTRVARVAAEVLGDDLYTRYYGIDRARVLALEERPGRGRPTFADLCRERAGNPPRTVAGNGMVIEQAQILTTHNLAALTLAGSRPADGWAEAALRAHLTTVRLVGALPRVRDALAHVKNAAFAWRQTVFLLSRCPLAEQREVLDRMEESSAERPHHVRERLEPALRGLRAAVEGRVLPDHDEGEVVRFLGWTARRHWMLRIAPQELLPHPYRL
ncbi:transcriptional regulator [Nocardiopsis sp. N85]|uniref:transcriptional regulator n=1 Tax=Nocardiopsis sp. N85 TaxID=3029400 RepID=UPI00237FC33A|nr:transcriptional regulator [Nocardiopsis sp. N85]MDE3724929.1 transcriptional regulator [Nocardiopsis sp. N85]